MGPLIKEKNIGAIESGLRAVIGAILLISAFIIDGVLRWIVGLIGVLFVLTSIFGY